MNKHRFTLTLNLILLLSLIITSCSGKPTLPNITIPGLTSPTATSPAPTEVPAQAAFPPALVETDPPLNTVIGHTSAITFYFNQAMNKPSVESAFSGLPQGAFTWKDDSTAVFIPSQPYAPNAILHISIANTIQSATGFGISEPIDLDFPVADYLRATNTLPKANATDVDVKSAIVASFNQPIVPLGAEADTVPAAFTLVPAAKGKGEWINTSTYVFYPDPALAGGTEYAVSLSADLKSATGVGYESTNGNAWKFVTARPQVVSLTPSSETPFPLDPDVTLTFNQPMDPKSVQASFVLNGPEGTVSGAFKWNDDNTVLIFKPNALLERNTGYTLNVSGGAKSQGGMTLGADYGSLVQTYNNLSVVNTQEDIGSVTFTFSAPLADVNYDKLVSVSPSADIYNTYVPDDHMSLSIYQNLTPDTDYTFTLPAEIKDRWGQSLGDPFVLNIHTPPARPEIAFDIFSNTSFVRPDEPVLFAKATNIKTADILVAPLSLQDFLTLQNSYDKLNAYLPENPSRYSQIFDLPPSVSQSIKLPLTDQKNNLPPGLYFAKVSSPEITSYQSGDTRLTARRSVKLGGGGLAGNNLVVSSQVNLTIKRGATEAAVWAVDLTSQTPVKNAPVAIYDNVGNQLVVGTTDGNGFWKGPVGDYDGQLVAILGAPGDEFFAASSSDWNTGVSAWNFGYAQNIQKQHTDIYMYTDRPIYRPGQMVYFRGTVREAFDGRYQLPTITTIPVTLNDANGIQLANLNLQLSSYGTFNGQFELPANAVPGYYYFTNQVLNFTLYFQVAEYRKPEIDLGVNFSAPEIKLGNSASAWVKAKYFFGAPAGNVKVNWAVYVRPDYFYLPNYQTGLFDSGWLGIAPTFDETAISTYYGRQLADGTDQTDARGILSIDLPAIPVSEAGQIVTLEATVEDESGFPVSARAQLKVHPADFYIGVQPDQWFGTAKSESGFNIYTATWAGEASSNQTLTAEFKQVRWEKETTGEYGFINYKPVYTPVSSTNLATGPDGRARVSFTPPSAGTYVLDVSGSGTRTQVLLWVGGSETAAWPDLPNQKIELRPDQDSYKPGDTARVFIPNPFATKSLALITVERGTIFKADVVAISGSGIDYDLPLTEEDAPNVYLSVIMIGQGNDFRSGLVELPVNADALKLNVKISANPPEAGPRDPITFDVIVTDQNGQPVQGEFSFAMVDKAVLALAGPNAEDIFPAFYKKQPLGIETGLSLTVYGGREQNQPLGGGGGGGGENMVLRQEFPDTAYWNPTLITNAEGRGQVTMTLPDSLTTWNIDVRGITTDSKVGQAESELISTKPLLIRPVTPRFLVSGDHVLMAAIVNNNTTSDVQAAINLQSNGFVLDDPGKATLNVRVPANGRYRAEWWGTAGASNAADLVFSVTTSGTPSLQDSARPTWGSLPILQYTAPQTFVTGGMLKDKGSQQEVISLPRTYSPTGGGLELELSPSLAGSLLSTLDAMKNPNESQSAEEIVSYILPNIEVNRALNSAGVHDEALSGRISLDLNASVSRLMSLQNDDGGWSWWGRDKSDAYISAYVFFGLQRARLAGATVNEDALSRAVTYLQSAQPQISQNTTGDDLDTIAFVQFALGEAKQANDQIVSSLYNERNRMSPAGRALTAYDIYKLNPADTRVSDMISNLETSAIITSSSTHWETLAENKPVRGSAIYTTAIALDVIAQVDPTNKTVFGAIRYLAAHRNADKLWYLGHDNAWAILALNAAMVGLGDMQSDFSFNATLNGDTLNSGDVAGIQTKPLTANVPIETLASRPASVLTINRTEGLGRLYYNAVLNVNRPVQDVKPLDLGMRVDRLFCKQEKQTCTPLTSLSLASTESITAQLTLVLPHDSYYVMVNDYIPAGMEILNQNLKTSQLGLNATDVQAQFDNSNPFADGWGWWLFNDPQIHDDSILFSANYLPAGTYVLTYTLIPLQAGEYHIMPAHAWQAFFPEVQGTSAGETLEIKP